MAASPGILGMTVLVLAQVTESELEVLLQGLIYRGVFLVKTLSKVYILALILNVDIVVILNSVCSIVWLLLSIILIELLFMGDIGRRHHINKVHMRIGEIHLENADHRLSAKMTHSQVTL